MALEALEWRLLLSSLAQTEPPAAAAEPSQPPAEDLAALQEAVALVESGRFLAVLSLPLAAGLLPPPPAAESGEEGDKAAALQAAAAYAATLRAALAARRELSAAAPPSLARLRALETLCLGVAALQVVSQANVTGPELGDAAPACPGSLAHPGGAAHPAWDAWAVQELSADGEEVLGKTALPQYLVLARCLLIEEEFAHRPAPEVDGASAMLDDLVAHPDTQRAMEHCGATGGLPTACWWASRCALLQQRLLARGAVSLRSELLTLQARTLRLHATGGEDGARASRCVATAALMEACASEQEYRQGDSAAALLLRALERLRVHHSVVGEMGMRTEHQVDAKAQLVLRWELDGEAGGEGEWSRELPALLATNQAYDAEEIAATSGVCAALGESASETDILHAPRLQGAEGNAAPAPPLPPLEAAALLLAAVCLRKSRCADELRSWEMAPFVEAVRTQRRGAPTLRFAADLHQARHERGRGRTRVRALAQLEELVARVKGQAGGDAPAEAADRARLAWCAWLPPSAALGRELGEQMLGCGLIGQALGVFQQLELWDPLVLCLLLAGKRHEAASLLNTRLLEAPEDPRLLCALGDATGEEAHYHSAWAFSQSRCGRAQRALAAGAARRSDWAAAAECWEAALRLNPLHSEGWFSLGHACRQLGRDERALQAFSRVTQMEGEHAEAWNNVAALSMRAGRPKAALAALSECVKYRRDAWQLWDNLASVAGEAAAWSVACDASLRLMALTEGKRPPAPEVLQGLLAAAEAEGAQSLIAVRTDELLTQACAAGAGGGGGEGPAELWALQARLRRLRGDVRGAVECLVRRLRALQDGAAWESEPEPFDSLVLASCDLARAHLDADSPARDLAGVRMQLRGALKRTEERFGERESHALLQAALAEVVAREAALKDAAAP